MIPMPNLVYGTRLSLPTEVLPDLSALSVAANLDDEVPGISLDVDEDKALQSQIKSKRRTRRDE